MNPLCSWSSGSHWLIMTFQLFIASMIFCTPFSHLICRWHLLISLFTALGFFILSYSEILKLFHCWRLPSGNLNDLAPCKQLVASLWFGASRHLNCLRSRWLSCEAARPPHLRSDMERCMKDTGRPGSPNQVLVSSAKWNFFMLSWSHGEGWVAWLVVRLCS